MRRLFLAAVLAALMGLISGCGGGGGGGGNGNGPSGVISRIVIQSSAGSSVAIGQSVTLTVQAFAGNTPVSVAPADLTWEISDPQKARLTVSQNQAAATITGLAVGTATVRVRHRGVFASEPFVVTITQDNVPPPGPNRVELYASAPAARVGSTITLIARVYVNDQPVTVGPGELRFRIANAAVAAFEAVPSSNDAAALRGSAAGTTDVTVQYKDNLTSPPLTVTFTAAAPPTPAITRLEIQGTASTLTRDRLPITLIARAFSGNQQVAVAPNSLTWQAADPASVEILPATDNDNAVTVGGKAVGTTSITVTHNSSVASPPFPITITAAP